MKQCLFSTDSPEDRIFVKCVLIYLKVHINVERLFLLVHVTGFCVFVNHLPKLIESTIGFLFLSWSQLCIFGNINMHYFYDQFLHVFCLLNMLRLPLFSFIMPVTWGQTWTMEKRDGDVPSAGLPKTGQWAQHLGGSKT